MKYRFLVLILLVPLFLAAVTGCGEDPSVRPKVTNTGKSAVKDTAAVQKQKPTAD